LIIGRIRQKQFEEMKGKHGQPVTSPPHSYDQLTARGN